MVNIAVANKLAEKHEVAIFTLSAPENEYLQANCPVYGQSDLNFRIFTGVSGILGMLRLDLCNRMWMAREAKKITRLAQKLKNQVVIVSSGSIYLIPFLKKQNPNKKIIAWCHFSADTYLNGYLRYTTNFWIKGLRAADEVVCLTPKDKEKFLEINKNTRVINNPLTLDNNEISSLDSKIISWTGRIANPHKGIDYLAKIAGKLPESWKISVAGDGDMELLEKYLAANNAQNKVVLRGSISGDELKKHYLNSSIYLMTSRSEGFGLVLVEAMSFGLPIVAFKQSSSEYVLDSGNSGVLVENGNIEAMVEALEEFIDDIEKRQSYQKKSLKRVEEFMIDKVAKEWERLIF
ncbi:glycosyltransferase [Lactococcus kimchii]|uniref:glycosyltransferase n=1 Tax=Lactococcus sp. S-13 TaxID=2507158 RepID=UPI001023A868|nr:glycosyltransferase [Lactococcus sp. S-13]RZI49601.1 glycosyltransferase family 4 protein [Lactococcus sp. S-13]